jgi:ataxia telangiectasia mutated family protein
MATSRFTDLERILATRASLIRSVRRKEERERIGDMITPFNSSLLELEKRCLVRLSVAARKSNKLQVALNSIVKARRLEGVSTHEVSQEFANVLWLQKEQKLAVQFLKDLLFQQSKALSVGPEPAIERALSMVRLVSTLLRFLWTVSSHGFSGLTGIVGFRSMLGKTAGYQAQLFRCSDCDSD